MKWTAALLGMGLTVAVTAATTEHTSAARQSPSTASHQAAAAADLAARVAPSDSPNVLLITTDDQSLTDLKVMNSVLRRLGDRGTTFTHAFSPYPLCCPARATILTGQYAHNNNVLGNKPPWGGFYAFDDTQTLPVWLQAAGYRTAILGKYLNQYPPREDPLYVPPGWDDWRVPVSGIYNYRKFVINDNGKAKRYSGRYQTKVVGDEAVDIINSSSPYSEPFFLWAGFLAPHSGVPVERDDPRRSHRVRFATPAVSPRYRDDLAGTLVPGKASINERQIGDKPRYVRQDPTIPRRALDEFNQQRQESLLSVDDEIDRILDALKANGELANTVIIFTSDNGFLVGEHRQTGKVVGYEESTRVPLIVAGPGFDTGRVERRLVSLADLAPTIADVTGSEPQLVQDGLSLSPSSLARGGAAQRAILLQAGPNRHQTTRWYTGIRTKRYVYVDYNTGERELYDLAHDPLQLANLAGKRSARKLEQSLATALAQLKNCAGASCRVPIRP